MQSFHRLIYTTWIVIFSVSLQTESSAGQINQKCPVEPSRNASTKYFAEHSGQKIYFCCAECIEEFRSSPETYLAPVETKESPAEDEVKIAEKAKWLFDQVWNAASKMAGITVVILLFLSVFTLHYTLSKFIPGTRIAKYTKMLMARRALPLWLGLLLGAEAISAHLMHHITRKSIRDSTLEHAIHYTTFVEYGDPPLPSRPDIPPRVNAVFYRGNDERNPSLFNGGNYRTATFHIDLCTQDGDPVIHGDPVHFKSLFFRVRFQRAAGTPEYFWKPSRMANIYATRDPGKFHWRNTEPAEVVPMTESVPMQEWTFHYPLASFTKDNEPNSVSGTFYICEKRFNDSDELIGGRFHCAFSFDLHRKSSFLEPDSDIWMGALYRKRSLRIWEIPESEWLSTKPIPEITDGHSSKDPVLLGIKDHEQNRN
ncbi:MAG: hypothetical protein MK183_01010 [Verrucomicrobiales bacterium]|nr:hypothetical protein [Verrucomicrobiales bacterium]